MELPVVLITTALINSRGAGGIELLQPSIGAVVGTVKRLEDGFLLSDLVTQDHYICLELTG